MRASCRLALANRFPSLDMPFASARVWVDRTTWSGARYQSASDSLFDDIRIAVDLDAERVRRNGWGRRKRLLAWSVPGVERRLAAGRLVRLLTLPGPGMRMEDLAQSWKSLAQRMKRSAGELEFCGTRAIGAKTGVPHVHVLCDWGTYYIPQGWFSMAWADITSYKVVDVRRVRDARAARYVASNVAGYLADQAGGRMFRSRGW